MRQVPIGLSVVGCCCGEAQLVIEVDGSEHADSKRGELRDDWLRSQRCAVLRFWNTNVLRNPDPIFETTPAQLPPSLCALKEGSDEPIVGALSPKDNGEGTIQVEAPPDARPHPRSARSAPDEGDSALSPRAGRGGLCP